MAVPDWNKLEVPQVHVAGSNEPYRSRPQQEVRTWNTDILNELPSEDVMVRTTHWGTASYTERGHTMVSIRTAMYSFAEYNLWQEYDIDPQNITQGDVLTICQSYFEDNWEIGEYDDLEHDNWDQTDSEIDEVIFA